jgi:hypothetical protein
MSAHSSSSTSQQKFLHTLSASMHQLAQPISTIQASLELAVLSPTTAAEYKEIAENILGQLRSAVESMQFAARLTRFQQPATDVRSVFLSTALDEVISGLQHTLDTARLQVLFLRPEHEQMISISVTRLRQMLFYVLQAVQGCSQPGDLAKIEIQELTGHLLLRIKLSAADDTRADRARPAPDGMADRALALADSIVTSAGGDFKVSTDPLLIVADFPVRHDGRAVTIDKSKVSDFTTSQSLVGSHRFLKTS